MRLPDKDEHRRAWAAVDMDTRRRIMRTVNRGRVLESKPDARLAVGVARQQQRFWSRVWIVAPLISLLFYGDGWVAVAANGLFATLFMGLMSAFWYRRARRSEALNRELLGLHPRATAPAEGPDEDAAEGSEDGRAGTPHAANPPKRSRRRRR